MSIVIYAQNNTAIDQQVQIRDNPHGLALVDVAIPVHSNAIIYVEPANENVDLFLICNNNTQQVAELNVVYKGFSHVAQNSDWLHHWTIKGAPDGVQLQLA